MYREKYFSYLSVEKPDIVLSTFVEYMHASNIHLGRYTCSANSAANCIVSVGFSITFILALLNQQEKQMLNKKLKKKLETSHINLKNDKHIMKVTASLHDVGKNFLFFV
jgi:hypothetical protein